MLAHEAQCWNGCANEKTPIYWAFAVRVGTVAQKMHIYIIYARDMYEDDIYKLPIRKTVNCANCANYP